MHPLLKIDGQSRIRRTCLNEAPDYGIECQIEFEEWLGIFYRYQKILEIFVKKLRTIFRKLNYYNSSGT